MKKKENWKKRYYQLMRKQNNNPGRNYVSFKIREAELTNKILDLREEIDKLKRKNKNDKRKMD